MISNQKIFANFLIVCVFILFVLKLTDFPSKPERDDNDNLSQDDRLKQDASIGDETPNKLLDSFFETVQPYYQKFCRIDRSRMQRLRNANPSNISLDEFHTILQDPFETVCKMKHRLGGEFRKSICKIYDGHKYLCMDGLIDDIERKQCVVYSFGIAGDWSFEDAVADMGCKVYAYDPSVDFPEKRSENVFFKKWGIASEEKDRRENFKTLKELLRINGHQKSRISYLKMDVEGAEIKGIPLWLKDGSLDHVQQFGLEIHLHFRKRKLEQTREFFATVKQLQLKGNFRLINWDPNGCMRMYERKLPYWDLAEIVFARVSGNNECVQ